MTRKILPEEQGLKDRPEIFFLVKKKGLRNPPDPNEWHFEVLAALFFAILGPLAKHRLLVSAECFDEVGVSGSGSGQQRLSPTLSSSSYADSTATEPST